jgi:hypothetical protein
MQRPGEVQVQPWLGVMVQTVPWATFVAPLAQFAPVQSAIDGVMPERPKSIAETVQSLGAHVWVK